MVLTGVAQIKVVSNGNPNTFGVRFTDVCAKRNGRWQVVTWQSRRLPARSSRNSAYVNSVAYAARVFGLPQSFLRFDTDALYRPEPRNDSEGGNMTNDRGALLAIAERIADAENRITLLRTRIERLKDEGSDASQAQEMFQVLSRNLGNLYIQQSVMRRASWAFHFAKTG